MKYIIIALILLELLLLQWIADELLLKRALDAWQIIIEVEEIVK